MNERKNEHREAAAWTASHVLFKKNKVKLVQG